MIYLAKTKTGRVYINEYIYNLEFKPSIPRIYIDIFPSINWRRWHSTAAFRGNDKMKGGGCFYFCVYSMVEGIYLLCLAVSRLKRV